MSDAGRPASAGAGARWRSATPAVLLAVIAGVGVWRSHTLEQSSWQGASFGMFATYDNVTSRAVRVTVEGPAGGRRVRLPPDLDDDAVRLKVVPTDGGARRLASDVLDRAAAGSGKGAARVVVEVWRIRIDDQDGRLRVGTERLARGVATP